MLERVLLSAASFVRRRPLLLLAVAVVAAAGLAAGIPRLKFQTGQDTLLDPSSKIARDNAAFQQQFGGDPMLGLFEAPERSSILQLFTKDNRAALQRVEQRLQATGDYQSILTPLTILQFAQQTIQAQMKTQPAKLQQDLTAAGTKARANAAARGEPPAQQDIAAAAAEKKVTDAFNAQYGADAQRFAAIANDQSFDNPKFLEFVLYGADGKIGRASCRERV